MCLMPNLSLSSCLFVFGLKKIFARGKKKQNFSEAAIFASQKRHYYPKFIVVVLHLYIIMSNNTNAMKRVERLKTHVVSAPLLNNDTNNNSSFLERQETSFFSSPFGVRSFVYCLFFSSSLLCVLCAFLSSTSKSSLSSLTETSSLLSK